MSDTQHADLSTEPTETAVDSAGAESAATPELSPHDTGEYGDAQAAESASEIEHADNADAADDEAPASSRRSRTEQLEKEGEVAADFLESLLDICDLDGDLDVDIDGDRAAVSLVDSDEGRVPRRLVGTNGSVLEALQELTRLAVQSQTGERSRLMLDVANFRAERKTALVEIARAAVAKVKDGSEREALEPMSAFERKVVHDEVLASGLTSESEGTEPRRFVVVLPA